MPEHLLESRHEPLRHHVTKRHVLLPQGLNDHMVGGFNLMIHFVLQVVLWEQPRRESPQWTALLDTPNIFVAGRQANYHQY